MIQQTKLTLVSLTACQKYDHFFNSSYIYRMQELSLRKVDCFTKRRAKLFLKYYAIVPCSVNDSLVFYLYTMTKVMYSVLFYRGDFHSVAPWPAAAASPGNLLEVQILRPHLPEYRVRNWGGTQSPVGFKQASWWFWSSGKFENH